MQAHLEQRLKHEVEGSCSGRFGFIVAVLHVVETGKGRVIPCHGLAEFSIRYMAIVCMPFKGEVVDGVVTRVNKMGFFAEIGPLTAFVSVHLLPLDMRFDPEGPQPSFDSEEQVVVAGALIRMKIIGVRLDAAEIFCIASIKEDYLGVIDQ